MLWRIPADLHEKRIGIMGAAQPFFAHQPTTRVHADRGFDRLCDANACSACSLAAGPLCGAQELPVIHREANPLDVPEQCCGLSLPTLANRGSAPWAPPQAFVAH